jgi:hypothetical protein
MSEPVVSLILLAALVVGVLRGPRSCFGWVYLPAVILVPIGIEIELPGIPNLSARRAALAGLALGALLTSRPAQLIPRWRWFDLLPMLTAISFAISFGMTSDFRGFCSRFVLLGMDWLLPYVFARALLDNARHVRAVLLPFVISFMVLAFLAVYEARMGYRLGAVIWNSLAGTRVPTYFFDIGGAGGTGTRWGYLRALATTTHPLILGTFFATAAPLVVLWGQLRTGSRLPVVSAALACAAGCVASLTRGPILVLLVSSALFTLVAYRLRSLGILMVLMLALATPLALDTLNEKIETINQDVSEATTDSALYRIVLLLIYTDQEFGLWGNPGIAGAEYENTVSIDNSYLFFFITGGWSGGTLFTAMMVTWLVLGWRSIRRARGRKRRVLSATLASLVCTAGCMADVWFAPDFWPLLFFSAALVINQSRSAWFTARVAPTTAGVGRPQEVARRTAEQTAAIRGSVAVEALGSLAKNAVGRDRRR